VDAETFRARRARLVELQLERGRQLVADPDLEFGALRDDDITAIARALVTEAGLDTAAMSEEEIRERALAIVDRSIEQDLQNNVS